jgi:putative hemolysin
MSAVTIEIVIILLLLAANGIFAMSELAIVSARKARLQQRAKKGDERASAALELANDPSRFLSTVQIGITLVGILAGAFGGATLAEQLGARISEIPPLEPYGEAVGVAVVVLGITFLSLVIGELVPKRLALHAPEEVASALAPTMRRLSVVASPFVRVLTFSTDLLVRLFGLKESKDPPITEEEIKILIQQGIQAGTFEEAEREMIERVFHLGNQRVGDLMTPRLKTVWLDLDDDAETIKQKIITSGHSRFPVAHDDIENIIGIVRARDLLARYMDGQRFDLKATLRKPLFFHENMPARKALEMFKKSRIHMGLVIDEYGSLQGVVTINDILEAIVGDMPTIDEPVEQPAVQREDGSWLMDGRLSVAEFKRLVGLEELPKEEESGYKTLAGFVLTYLGRIPKVAEHFEWRGLRIEVLDMDGRRIDKLLVIPNRSGQKTVA